MDRSAKIITTAQNFTMRVQKQRELYINITKQTEWNAQKGGRTGEGEGDGGDTEVQQQTDLETDFPTVIPHVKTYA